MDKPEDSAVEKILDQATLAYARELEKDLTSHPATETLIAFQEGRLPSEEAAETRHHLVACRQCTDELRRLDTFDETGEPGEERDPELEARMTAEAISGWQRFQERLETQPRVGEVSSAGTAGGFGGAWPVWLLAASVVLALAGAFSLFHAFQGQDARRPPSGAHPFIIDLFPDGSNAYRNSEFQTVEVPTGMDLLILRLLLGDQTRYNEYSASLVPTAGETIWQQTDLQRQPTGGFVLLIPRALVPPGEYVIRLSGESERTSKEIASYSFHIRDIE